MKVAAQEQTFASAATGIGFVSIPISFAGVGGYVARFQSTFDEVRVLSAMVRITPVSSSAGMTKFFWSEKALVAVPTSATVAQRITRDIANSNGAGTGYVMRFASTGFQDLSWDPVSAPVAAAYFNIYTDPAYATPATVNSLFVVQVELNVQLRGIASQ